MKGGGLRERFLFEITEKARGTINTAVALLAASGHLSARALEQLNRVLAPAAETLGFTGGMLPTSLGALRFIFEKMLPGFAREDVTVKSYNVEVCNTPVLRFVRAPSTLPIF